MGIPKDKVVSRSPGTKFPCISVTGGNCSLMCSHCLGKHLEGMISVKNPADLWDIAKNLHFSGGKGMLISGGSDEQGKVPLLEYIPIIRKISDLGLKINIHPGILTKGDENLFSDIDNVCLSVDVHQDPEIIKNVFKLKGPEVYEDSLKVALSTGCKVVPHLTVGLSHKDLKESAELVKRFGIDEIVLLSLVPTEGTEFETSNITEDEIINAVIYLIDRGFIVTLGCMRDRTMRTLEKICIEAGVRNIANMSLETENWAKSEGYEISREDMCCCFSE